MKRTARFMVAGKGILLIFLILTSLPARAQFRALPDDARFNAPVALQTGLEGESLRDVIVALAASVGLTAIVDENIGRLDETVEPIQNVTITTNITVGKPFRQVWGLLLALNNLDYLLLENDLVVVSTGEVIDRLAAGAAPATDPFGRALVQRIYPVLNQENVTELKALLDERFSPAETVTVTAFANLNLLFVRAAEAQQQEVARLLYEADRPFEDRVLRRYPLSFARAEEVAAALQRTTEDETLRAAYAADAVSNSVLVTATLSDHREIAIIIADLDGAAGQEAAEALDAPPPEPALQRFYRSEGNIAVIRDFLLREFAGLNINTLEEAGLLSVRATAAQHEEIAAVLAEIGRSAPRPAVEQRLYTLSNARAAELAEVLQASAASFLQTAEDGVTLAARERDLQESGFQEGMFLVVADPRTNSLLITAPAAVQSRIAELLPQLDAPQPQVNIQVRIQEISSQAALNLGLNLNAGLGNFAATVLEGGLNFVFDPESVLSGLTIGAVLDTLERQRLSRRVDDSNLTVLNNGEARIQAGGTIFISLVGANATIEREIPYGVQVGVTPQIAGDGRIQLTVEARVEDVLSEIDNPNFVNLSTRNVLSTISILPGQTVVLGGLLQNSLTTSESRVPVLGSLPLIGGLFRSTSSSEDSVELLLIINAAIID